MGKFDIPMQVDTVRPTRAYKPYEEFVSKRITSVWLDHSQPSDIQPFRCTVCGNVVFEHSGDVSMLVAGYYLQDIPVAAGIILKIIQCGGTLLQRDRFGEVRRRNCHARYQIC